MNKTPLNLTNIIIYIQLLRRISKAGGQWGSAAIDGPFFSLLRKARKPQLLKCFEAKKKKKEKRNLFVATRIVHETYCANQDSIST